MDVNLEGETVWLSLEQMSRLFGRDKSVISRHIIEEGELEKIWCYYAAHGNTAAEVIYKRADSNKPFVGLTSFKRELFFMKRAL